MLSFVIIAISEFIVPDSIVRMPADTEELVRITVGCIRYHTFVRHHTPFEKITQYNKPHQGLFFLIPKKASVYHTVTKDITSLG